jgi:organic hydroperoxide reductase OsmC/OhrA
MAEVTVELRNINGTEAALGWAGGHTIVVDRPEGRAGGQGLGFNGAQLLGLAIGGCFCNDLRYAAHEQGIELGNVSVSVTVELGGEPLLVTAARLHVRCALADGSDSSSLIENAKANSTVANSLKGGIPVSFVSN